MLGDEALVRSGSGLHRAGPAKIGDRLGAPGRNDRRAGASERDAAAFVEIARNRGCIGAGLRPLPAGATAEEHGDNGTAQHGLPQAGEGVE